MNKSRNSGDKNMKQPLKFDRLLDELVEEARWLVKVKIREDGHKLSGFSDTKIEEAAKAMIKHELEKERTK